MSDSLQIVGLLIMIAGALVGILVARRNGLFAFDGTLYRHRIYYTLSVFIIVTLANSFLIRPALESLKWGIAIGIPLSLIGVLGYMGWIRRHLDGHVLRYKQNQYNRNLLWCVPFGVGAFAMGFFDLIPSSFDLASFVITIHVAWFFLTAYSFYDLRKRESALGMDIVESSEPRLDAETN